MLHGEAADFVAQRRNASENEIFKKLLVAQRSLDVAVSAELYERAAKCRDDIKAMFESLPPVQQFWFQQVKVLRNSESTFEDKLKAISGLGAAGDGEVIVPILATLLPEPELQPDVQTAMWTIFLRCKDPVAQEALQEGTRMMPNETYHDQALKLFEQVINKCPGYAEGYNKRATLLYIQRKFPESVEDCKATLRLQPFHFGAASGMGLSLLQMGQYEEALQAFDTALGIHPGLTEIRKVAAGLRAQLSIANIGGGGDKESSSS